MASGSSGRALKLLALCVRSSAGKIVIGLTCALLASGAMLTLPYTMKMAIDDVFPSQNTSYLTMFLGGVALLYLLKNLFVLLGRRVMLRAGEDIAFSLRTSLFSHLQSMSVGYHKSRKPGESLSRITGDVSQVEGFIETGVPKTLNTLLLLTGVLVIIFRSHPLLAGVSLLVLPVHLALYVRFRGRIKAGNRSLRENEAGLASGLVEALLGAEVMTASAAENYERDRFYQRASGLLNSKLHLASMQLWQKVLGGVAIGLGTVAVYYYGGRSVMDGKMQVGEFTAFLLYLRMLYPLSLTMMTQMSHTVGTVASAERLMDLMEARPEVVESSDPVTLPDVEGSVEFRDVAFNYNEKSGGFYGLNLTAKAGEVVAITGPVGSGKSTIAYLLARFYDARQGIIRVDNVELKKMSLQQLRSTIGIVFQEPYLFSGTIADNIRYSLPEATQHDVEEVVDLTGLRDFIESLPDGLDTAIGENGIQLSLGQKHRIDMARALIKRPKILVLDSVLTEGDDAHRWENERLFRKVSAGRTVFVINPPAFIYERANKVIKLHQAGSVEVETNRLSNG